MSKSQKSPTVKPATLERGEARYFHGRVKILDNFKELLGRAKAGNSGTSILIQAAPGAGKTALLHECARLARAQRWQTAKIQLDALWDPTTLLQSLGRNKEAKQKEHGWNGKLEGGGALPGFGSVKGSGGYESRKKPALRNTLEVLKDGEGALLLTLDEAQILAKRTPSEQKHRVTIILDSIHNGGVERPVILIAAGLGATSAAFDSLGISRFDPGCQINLGPLSEGTRRAVIQDWLLEEGGAKGNPVPWIDAIAVETHGWPQHIMAYVWPALKQLELTEGELTPEGLKTVLKEGRKGRIRFYEARAQNFPREQLHCIARVIAHAPSGTSIAKMDIIASLRLDYDHDTAEKIFTLALHKGILDMRDNRYVVPIPSMHDWLVDNFARYRAPLFPPDYPRENA